MLVDIFGVHPTTSEHPHKLSERIVKDLSAATGEVRPFYSVPPCCQLLIRCVRIGAELPVRTERAAHSTATSTAVNPALATSQTNPVAFLDQSNEPHILQHPTLLSTTSSEASPGYSARLLG